MNNLRSSEIASHCNGQLSTETITGQFRLSDIRTRSRSDGTPFLVLTLDDAMGRLIGLIGPERPELKVGLSAPSLVAIRGERPRLFNNEVFVDIVGLRPLGVHEISVGAALLPRSLCPKGSLPALDRLIEFHQSIGHPALRGFLTAVLLDESIGPALLRCKGSQGHHHADTGGLLRHCVLPLAQVRQMIEIALPGDRDAHEITQLGFLLHDLGKIRTVGEQCRPADGYVLRHEFFTGQLLGPHLDTLSREWPDGATALRYILDYCDQPHRERGRARFIGAEIVVWMDCYSAASDQNKGFGKLFERVPATRPGAVTDVRV